MNPESPTYHDLLRDPLGDEPVTVKFTARELGAVQFVLFMGARLGAGALCLATAEAKDLGDEHRIAFNDALAKCGLGLAKTFGNADFAGRFSAKLAESDQERAARKAEGV